MDLGKFTPEQLEKASSFASSEEALRYIRDEGIELSDEQLDAVSGGWESKPESAGPCIRCGSTNTEHRWVKDWTNSGTNYRACLDCGATWWNPADGA